MKTNAKRLMSFLLAMCMILCTVPMVFADGEVSADASSVKLVETYPQMNKPSAATGKITIRFDGAMSADALKAASYKVTGGVNPVTVNSVTQGVRLEGTDNNTKFTPNTYFLNVSGMENNMKYTVSFNGLKDAENKVLPTEQTSFSFYTTPMCYDIHWTYGSRPASQEGGTYMPMGNYMYGNNIKVYMDEALPDLSKLSDTETAGADESPISSCIRFVPEKSGSDWDVKLIPANGSWAQISALEKGKKYIVSYRYKGAAEKTAGQGPKMYVMTGSGGDDLHWGSGVEFNKTTWQWAQFEVTATSASAPVFLINNNAKDVVMYLDDIKIYKKPTYTVDTVNSYPSDTEVVMPTDTIKVKFTGPMSEAALNKNNYTISGVTTDGSAAPAISVTEVKELDGNVYELKLSAETANMAKYNVNTKNMTDFLGSAVADANIRFISGEKILKEDHFNNGDQPLAGGEWLTAFVSGFYYLDSGNNYKKGTTEGLRLFDVATADDADGNANSKAVTFKFTGRRGVDADLPAGQTENDGDQTPYRISLFNNLKADNSWTEGIVFGKTPYRISFKYKASENISKTMQLCHDWDGFSYPKKAITFSTEWKKFDEVITPTLNDNTSGQKMFLAISKDSDGSGIEAFKNKTLYFDDIKVSQPMTKPTTVATVTDKATGALGTNEVTLTFSDQMDATSVANKANYVLKNGEDAVEGGIKSVVYSASEKKAVVTLDKISPNTDYTLEYKNLEDFYFNKVADGTHTVGFNADVKVYGDVKLYSADAEVTALGDEAAEITAKFDGVMNYSGNDVNVKLIVAYFEDGVLKDVKTSDAEVKNNQVLTNAISAKVNAGAKADGVTRSVKAFVFNGSTLAPLNGGASAGETVATPGE